MVSDAMPGVIKRFSSLPSDIHKFDTRVDEVWDIYSKLITVHGSGRLRAVGSGGDMSPGQDESTDETPAVFPPTYIVIQFSRHIQRAALVWLLDKICGKRLDGGAELLVRKQPRRGNEGLTLHVSASKIKFLEVAEELELRKTDKCSLVREFTVSQLDDFLQDGMHVDDLLTTAEKQYIVRHELENIRALTEDDQVPGYPAFRLYEGQSIIQVCLHWKLLDSLYPLHDQEALSKLGIKWYWSLFRTQPFEEIRLYFGEAVALYFTFLDFYTKSLLVPMGLGLLQLFLCTESMAFFCVLNVLWVSIFLEVWKRRCSELAFSWGTIGMTSLDEPRPNFHGVMGVDKVTGRYQPQFPRWRTNARLYCVSLPIVLLCMVGAFFVMLTSFWAEEMLINMKKQQGLVADGLLVLLPSITYSAVVYIMNRYYRQLATVLTEWENHRTQSQFDRHRVTKLVLFEFVNNFMSLFYIAFYVQDMEMLKNQLTVMLIIFQAINNFQEAILPLLVKCCSKKVTKALKFGSKLGNKESEDKGSSYLRKRRPTLPHQVDSTVLADIPALELDDPRIELALTEGELDNYEGTYDDYLEMFIQFGYVFLFSSVYPMAAFWAVLNNVLETRADAFKLCCLYKRPIAKRVKDTGAWQRAFEAVCAMSIMTNCGLLCMSPQLRLLAPSLTSVEWVLLFVLLEHVLLGIRHILHLVIPDRPEWVRVALARINHQSKQALKNERTTKNRRHFFRRHNTAHASHNRSN